MARAGSRQTGTQRDHQAQSERPADSSALVPSRRQYLELKQQYPHAILLYRLGDFYEAFDDDAHIVARDARITLTSRSFGRNGRVPMAGIPHHALNYYLSRLLAAGHTVAIAEQLSEPGRGLVERAVTRVLTPGTVAETALLPSTENRYLAAIAPLGDRIGLAWVDVSTGEFTTLELNGPSRADLLRDELARLNPAECLLPDTAETMDGIIGHITRLPHWHFAPERAAAILCEHFHTQALTPFGCEGLPGAIGAAGAILVYLQQTNPALLAMLTSLRTESLGRTVWVDAATRRNLELTRSLHTGGTRGSLLSVLDHTKTAMGARTLRRIVSQPLRDLAELQRRQGIIAALVAATRVRHHLGHILTSVGDLERLISRVTQGLATARDLLQLKSALEGVEALLGHLQAAQAPALRALAANVPSCADLATMIEAAIVEDAEGVRIRPGFSPALDQARDAIRETRQWLASLEQQERERTGIRSLKVGYNKVFGYYIEVTRPNLPNVPPDYIRKQTVANGERFITAALKEAEARILAAEGEIEALERAALTDLCHTLTSHADRLLQTARRVAELDAFIAMAEAAVRYNWVAPILDESDCIEIVQGRHPVVEATMTHQPFIPNDCSVGGDGPRILLVTGPNMGGKSTYLRQVALIVWLAQIGSFVPAERARIGLVDRIFSRIGAHDDLAGGQSTFMVEMVETATILHQATRKSLVILDEIGRGTSTYDGLAIARAVLEDLHDRIGARTLFATHYLELTALSETFPGIANAHVEVLERDGRVIFFYTVRPGPADRAYGIHVARLAGLPPWVADRAEAVLAELTNTRPVAMPAPPQEEHIPASPWEAGNLRGPYQLPLAGFPPPPVACQAVAHELAALDLSSMTPREALTWLFEQQARLRGHATHQVGQ